ncbi:uncharacterized protein BJ171DRAFT_197463 [Polychytrium aggregatum]|uniref:uncharacterized protein n=1 Tax=Polychytrium aggregatum TaxID=110093 RepID=UPI0022FDD4C7|nr:uncharacterized protein BJ171DRAFT_197463 [Polychytrium aggregatum]KAI9201906.1 hypothetical protein BJ171DRAFT_197463 [Polychytrium aggregatum]
MKTSAGSRILAVASKRVFRRGMGSTACLWLPVAACATPAGKTGWIFAHRPIAQGPASALPSRTAIIMSFRFAFAADDEDTAVDPSIPNETVSAPVPVPVLAPAKLLEFDDHFKARQLDVIAEVVETTLPVFRRSLADVKLHVARGDADDDLDPAERDAQNIVFDQTDLIGGVYEGGLKTWECSIDLVNYLSTWESEDIKSKRVFEIGCGSALPGVFCLAGGAHVDFQDYNEHVLRLVTLPNALLNTISRPLREDVAANNTFDKELSFRDIDTISARFWSGDWGLLASHFEHVVPSQKYDIVLTSETIYAAESHRKLYNLIYRTLSRTGKALVAAKDVYFGCSGSLFDFLQLVQKEGHFRATSVFVVPDTVRREIVMLEWIDPIEPVASTFRSLAVN